MNDYREKVVEAVKAAGQELIDRADEIVGYRCMRTSFSISIDIDVEQGINPPYITVTQSYVC